MSSAGDPILSHGRGGQGNIGPDPTEYEDAEIHREGDPTASGHPFSAGRGGAGNISPLPGSPPPPNAAEAENDIVPDSAIVETPKDQAYHTGRGGEGNAHTPEKIKTHEGLADKLKHKLFKHKK